MAHNTMSDAFPAPQHNHAACLDDAIRSAREAFERHAMPFTPLREKVFREIAGSHKAVGAYDVLNSLAKKGRRLTPISVYRIINTLVDVGVVRRFKSRNAFYASISDDPMSPRIVLACENCGRVADADGVPMFRGMRRALYRWRLLGSLGDRGNQRNGNASHDREDFLVRTDQKPFAIMNGGRKCEVSEILGADVIIYAAPALCGN